MALLAPPRRTVVQPHFRDGGEACWQDTQLRVQPTTESFPTGIALPDAAQTSQRRTVRVAAISHRRFAHIGTMADCDITSCDLHNVQNGSRHFCAAGTFCASFCHATTPPRHACRLRIRLSYKCQTTFRIVCSRCFWPPPEMRHTPEDRPHERLSRHHIAPAARKSAVYTSSHGPVWLFILRCG